MRYCLISPRGANRNMENKMTIKCSNLEQFLDVIQGLTVRGLTFEANADTLIVTTLGGF